MRLFIFILLLSISSISLASDSTKNEKIHELLNLLDMDSMVESMYSQMEVMMQNMSKEMGVIEDEKPILDKYYSKMTSIMKEEMSWEKIEPAVIDIYERNFSDKEIEDMLAFYRTESGKSLITKMPLVMQESIQVSQQFAQTALPKIQAISLELAKDLEEKRSIEQ